MPERSRLLDLMPAPEAVIPALPEAELCFIAKAVGLADAGWILEHASDTQVQACFDLDAWHDDRLDPRTVATWFDALSDANSETLVRGARAIDAEILYLYLRSRISAYLKPNDDSWSPDEGDQTLEGQFYYRALADSDDLETVTRLLRGLFEEDYWLYFRMLQALTWEDPTENEEFALRWRVGRLEDLGFPTWEEAMRIYGFLRPEQRLALPVEGRGPLGGELAAARLDAAAPRGHRRAPSRVPRRSLPRRRGAAGLLLLLHRARQSGGRGGPHAPR